MKRAVAAVTSLTIIALTFAAGCGPSGPSTRAEVCSAFTTLGAQAMQGNGVFGNPLFTKAGDLADVAGRFPGSPNLASDSSALHAIADSDSTSELALMNATQHIAALCGQGLGIGSLFGDTGGDGVTGSGTYGTASAPTASEPTSAAPIVTSPDVPTETTATSPPSGLSEVDYQQVSGPGGLTVDVPAGWVLTGSPSVDNEQADDPADAQRFVRFGASTPAKASQRDEILAGERTNPNIQRGYHRVQLTSLTFQGGDAVDWEFTFSKAGVTRHARGLYWRANGLGYVVYVSGPDSAWAPLQPVFDRMVASVITH